MSRPINFFGGSQWNASCGYTPVISGFHDAPNVAATDFPSTSTQLFHPAAFTAEQLREMFYRIRAIHVEGSGTWDFNYDSKHYTGTWEISGDFGLSKSSESELFISQPMLEFGTENLYSEPVGSETMTWEPIPPNTATGGSSTSDLIFFFGLVVSTEYGPGGWATLDGTTIRYGLMSSVHGGWCPIGTLADPRWGQGQTPVIGSMTVEGVTIPLHAELAGTASIAITPIEYWPYGPEDVGEQMRSGVVIASDDWSS